jgi:hypothetical protein
MAEEIDALYQKFVLGTNPVAAPPGGTVFVPEVFAPTPAAVAAFAARFGLTAADLTGDNAEQAAVTARNPEDEIPWPRIAPLPTPLKQNAVEEYAGECYRPDGTHAPCSKTTMAKWRHSVALLLSPDTNTSDKANAVLTGAGNAEPRAVCTALLTGLVKFPTMGNVTYPGFATPDDVIAKLAEIPPPATPYDPSKPGPSGRLP